MSRAFARSRLTTSLFLPAFLLLAACAPDLAASDDAAPVGDAGTDEEVDPLASYGYGLTPYPGWLTEVSYGTGGALWGIGGGGSIWSWDPAVGDWRNVPGVANQVAVGPNGDGWALGADSLTYYGDGFGLWWHAGGGIGSAIAMGGGGASYTIGLDGQTYRWDGAAWNGVGGWATRVAADPWGRAWVIGGGQGIYMWDGGAWHQYPGAGYDITATREDGAIYVIGTDFQVYELEHDELGRPWWSGTNVWGRRVAGGDKRGHFWVLDHAGALHEASKARRGCTATCYVVGLDGKTSPQCPGNQVKGDGSTCAKAQQDAQPQAPRGCRLKHCRCDCGEDRSIDL